MTDSTDEMEQGVIDVGFCKHGLWPHENCRDCAKDTLMKRTDTDDLIDSAAKDWTHDELDPYNALCGALRESLNDAFAEGAYTAIRLIKAGKIKV